MTYSEIAQHLEQQKEYLIDLIEEYDGTQDKEIKAIFDGTAELLDREGYGIVEIQLLMQELGDLIGWKVVITRDMKTRGNA